jgi:hypothetical protein
LPDHAGTRRQAPRRLKFRAVDRQPATVLGAPRATAVVLASLSALHAAWGFGSAFPFRDHATLADTVAGTRAVPQPRACLAVAGLLLTAAAIVDDALPLRADLRRVGALGVGGVLGARGVLGVAGRTDLVVSWTPSARFVRLDRRYYGPLCLALSAGATLSTLTTAQQVTE